MRTFRCAVCGGVFATDTTEDEINQEFLASGQPDDDSGLSSACDECYTIVMTKARELGLLTETSAPSGAGERPDLRTPPTTITQSGDQK